MKQLMKRLLFSEGITPRSVLFGPGRGITILVDPMIQAQRLLGLAESEVSKQFVEFAKRCKTFCDVGASDGWYCLLARKHNPIVKVLAFEPESGLGKVAREQFKLNNFPDECIEWRVAPCGSTGVRLDTALANASEPIFIKVDIEGAELDALQSEAETIANKKCLLIVETHAKDLEIQCKNWLEGHGYRVRIIPKSAYRRLLPERRPLPHNQWLTATRER